MEIARFIPADYGCCTITFPPLQRNRLTQPPLPGTVGKHDFQRPSSGQCILRIKSKTAAVRINFLLVGSLHSADMPARKCGVGQIFRRCLFLTGLIGIVDQFIARDNIALYRQNLSCKLFPCIGAVLVDSQENSVTLNQHPSMPSGFRGGQFIRFLNPGGGRK